MPTARRSPDVIELDRHELGPLITTARRLLRDRDGWINLSPDVADEDLPEPSPALGRLFTSRGPLVPLASWVPGARSRNGSVEPVSLGLQHGGGPKAVRQLRDAGLVMPEGWRVLADHPRRGFVITVPDEDDPRVALAWVIEAAVRLTPFALPDRWHAGIFSRV